LRLDLLLVQKKLAASRTQAQELIRNGHVFLKINSEKKVLLKPNHDVSDSQHEFVAVDENALQ